MNKRTAILILSCDRFADLWEGQIRLLEENWFDREADTYIVCEGTEERHIPGVQILRAGEGTEWSERLGYALEQIQAEYVFITLDDYYLIQKVENRGIQELMDMMESEKIDYVRLFSRPKRARREEIGGYRKIHRIDISCDYSVNLYPGIWKKEFLASTIRKTMNAWQYEVFLHKRAEEYGARCAVSLRNEYRILDVVRKGKILHKAATYFRKHPGIYSGDREIISRKDEIKLTIQQQFARHLPLPVKNAVKRFMTKRGRRYYSDMKE